MKINYFRNVAISNAVFGSKSLEMHILHKENILNYFIRYLST